MKNIFLYFFFLSLSHFTIAQTESFEWVKQMQGDQQQFQGDQQMYIEHSIIDNQGNILCAGRYSGIKDFDPGPGVQSFSAYGTNGFIAKYSPDGNLIWAKDFVSDIWCSITQIIIHQDSNIFMVGHFSLSTDLDPGIDSTIFTTDQFEHKSFICKLDSNGQFSWVKVLAQGASSIKFDALDNIFVSGSFGGTIDFDPGPSTTYLSTPWNKYNSHVCKFDSDGQFIWAKQFESDGNNYARHLAIDENGKIIITGELKAITDFDPSINNDFNLISYGGDRIYICKLDSNGDFIWAKSILGKASDMAIDVENEIYITGSFRNNSIDLDPGQGEYIVNLQGDRNTFILKLDTAGNFNWANAYQSTQDVVISAITLDALGDIYTTGFFEGSADFDLSANDYTLSSTLFSAFIHKINSSGEFIWTHNFSSEDGRSVGTNICVDDSFEVYTSGQFTKYTEFGIGTTNQLLDGGMSGDGFIHKINQPISTVGISEIYLESPYTVHPNPASNLAQIYLGGKENLQISLFDIHGKQMTQFQSDQEYLTLDVSNYIQGVYFIHIRGIQQAEVLKLVVE